MSRRLCMLAIAAVMLGSVLTSVAAAGDPTLLGWWKFDDGAGDVAKDSSGNGYDGTVYDAAWVEGNLGGALEFTGSEYVDVPAESWSTITTQASVAFWAYGDPDSQPQSNFIFGAFSDPADNNARKMSAHVPWGNGNIYFDTGGPGYDRIDKAGEAAHYEGNWTHWALVKNADTGDQQIFVNGELWHSGTGMTQTMEGVTKFTIGTKPSLAEGWYQGKIDDFRLYGRALTAEDLPDIMAGKGPGMGLAAAPSPANEATDIPRDVPLAWEAGEYAVTHDVYLGMVFDDVNDASRSDDRGVLVSQGQSAATYDLDGVFEFGQTYYWRIDEVNGAPDNTIFKGDTWSFTVEPLAYPIANVTATSNIEAAPGAGPENLVNGSGLNADDEHSTESTDMWQIAPNGEVATLEFAFDGVEKLHEMLVWNYNVQFELMLGFGVKDVTIEYSENGADWATLGDVTFNQATASTTYAANTTVDFGGVAAQYVKITINSGFGMLGQFGLSEVRFMSIPVQAREPQPEDGATGVAADADASWRAGREAVSSEVALSTDADALELIDTVTTPAADLGALDLDATYYWQITEVNDAEAISRWTGPVWSFSTEAYIVVEDFESYIDDEGGRIYETWVDGYGVNGNGSQVGHLESPFAEQTIVKNGKQSMPLFFDNTGGTSMSEAERTLEVSMDWTVHGIKSLSLAFAGDADNTPGQLYVKVNGTKIVYGGTTNDLQISGWLAWTIDTSELGNVSNVTTLTIGVEGAGATGVLYVDDIRLYPLESAMIEPVALDATGLVAHYTLDANFQDSSGNGNSATPVGDAAVTNDAARGGVASLDGLGDAIQVPALAGGTATELTISAWVNLDVAWTSGLISVFHNDGWAAGDVHMHINSPGVFTAGINGLGADLRSSTGLVVDEWYNVTLSVSASEAALYVNGVQESLRIPTEAPEAFSFGEGHLGAWLNNGNIERAVAGQIDDVRFYNQALSYGEVMTLAGRTTPLYESF